MIVIKGKSRKAITRQVKKLVKKHGPEKALGLATALVESVVAATKGEGKKTTKKPTESKKPEIISETTEKKASPPATAKKGPRVEAKKKGPRAATRKKPRAVAPRKKPQAASNQTPPATSTPGVEDNANPQTDEGKESYALTGGNT